MMKIGKITCIWVLLLSAMTGLAKDRPGAAPKYFDRAGALVEMADASMEDGDVVNATAAFGEALKLYDRITLADPAWKPQVVAMRRSYVNLQMSELAADGGGRLERAPAVPAAGPPSMDAASALAPDPKIESGTKTREGLLVSEVQRLEAELIILRERSRKSAAPAQDHTALVVRIDELEAENKKLKARRGGLFGGRSDDSAKKEIRELKDKLKELKKQNVELATRSVKLENELKKGGVSAESLAASGLSASGKGPIAMRPEDALGFGVESTPLPEAPSEGAARHSSEEKQIRAMLSKGDAATALRMIDQALSTRALDPMLLYYKGLACCQTAQYERAIAALRQVKGLQAEQAETHVLLGSAYLGLGNLGKASIELQDALDINPDISEAHYNLAQIYLSLNPPDPKIAETYYRRSVELGGNRDDELERQLFR